MLVHTARQRYTADLADLLTHWEPALATLTRASAHDDPHAAAVLFAYLAPRRQQRASIHLAERLERVLTGERNPDALTSRLDDVGAAIVTRALDLIAGRATTTATVDDLRVLVAQEQSQALVEIVVTAAGGDRNATQFLEEELLSWAAEPALGPLTRSLRRILTGERHPDHLLTGLEKEPADLVTKILHHLADGYAADEADPR
jgi:hypothetical protein